ncbi:uncharacterized protein N7498_008931 [Penicillium cinerascens]|uniref:Helitron helicase-like domain-containing protein n=1 Tax=Penicillium cinerascens TaxID=70096 RepID=A0A9W9JEG7_9EURO|nr:uncharacterized protein N7498_008931 [Penicillium cinerascens]KAJ5195493.1 hypothetical protein N7498_008931 [Penicillium cinerascens]
MSHTVSEATDFGDLFSTSFNPFVNSFQQSTPSTRQGRHLRPQQTRQGRHLWPRQTRRTERPTQSHTSSFIINQGLDFLRQEHASRVYALSMFPPEISSPHIRQSVARFENNMALASRDTICCSCGMLVILAKTSRFLDGDSLLLPLEGFLDTCGYNEGFWNLCSTCHAALLRGSFLKFSGKNNINVTLCQHYPEALKDLTLTEEYLITMSHPVGVVVKLRPGGQTTQNLFFKYYQALIYSSLSSSNVRKYKVLAALRYLVRYNPLYGDQVIYLGNTDHLERAGYSVNLQEGNYENDWRAVEDHRDHFTDDALPVTASVTIDLKGDRQNPDLRLLNTMYTLIDDPPPNIQPLYTPTSHASQTARLATAQQRNPVIEYGIRGQASLLNQWQDPHYLTSAFPALFPAGIGGHLDHLTIAAGKPFSSQLGNSWLKFPATEFVSWQFSSHQAILVDCDDYSRTSLPSVYKYQDPFSKHYRCEQNFEVFSFGKCSTDLSVNVASAIRYATATSDPVTVARSFTIYARRLLGSKSTDIGILGEVSNYFSVVESNGRGILYLHTLVWVRGNLDFIRLRDLILADDDFASRMIGFLESIVKHSLHNSHKDQTPLSPTQPLLRLAWKRTRNSFRTSPIIAIVLLILNSFIPNGTRQLTLNTARKDQTTMSIASACLATF